MNSSSASIGWPGGTMTDRTVETVVTYRGPDGEEQAHVLEAGEVMDLQGTDLTVLTIETRPEDDD